MAEPRVRVIEADPAGPTQPGVVMPPPHPGPGGHTAPPPVVPARRRPWLSPLNQRRWRNFKKNRRAYWSMWIFAVLFGLSLFAEFIANDKPILVQFQGNWYMPIFQFYPETTFGGDFRTEAVYRDIEVRCLIMSGGLEACFDDPEGVLAQAETGVVNGETIQKGWMLWPPIPYSFDTINDIGRAAPSPPDANHLLGTDDTARDVAARVIYGFRLSILFTLIVTTIASIIGIVAGALQGFFGGLARPDLPAVHRDLGVDALTLHHHHHVRDPGAKFLASGVPHGALRLACARGRGAGRISAGRGTSSMFGRPARSACRT
jgi:microcin C transport system permease protein